MRISDSSQRNNQFQPINNNCNISNRAFAFDEDYFNQVKKKRTNFNTILEGFCMEQQNKHIRSFKQITEDIDEVRNSHPSLRQFITILLFFSEFKRRKCSLIRM
jgi:hypothetical protein